MPDAVLAPALNKRGSLRQEASFKIGRRGTHQLNRQSTASQDSSVKTGKAANGSLLHYLRVLAFRLEGLFRLPIDGPNVDIVESDLFAIMGRTISTVMNIILKAVCVSCKNLCRLNVKTPTQS